MNSKEQLIKSLELKLLSPEVRKSPERLSELLADDFFEFTKSGTQHNKESIVTGLPKCPEEIFITREFEVKEIAADTFLCHYIADREVVETKAKTTTLCSSIWQKRESGYQMIFFQGTTAK